MGSNIDERLLEGWLESQQRQECTRVRLATCSLPAERFEAWALDLIAEAFSASLADPAPLPATSLRK